MKLYVVAVEPSADQLAAELVRELRLESPDLTFAAIGGQHLRDIGVPSQMETEGLAIVGITEALFKLPAIYAYLREATDRILTAKPDAVIMVDSYGFMIRLAKRLRKAGYQGQLIKYVAPQVWAMRPGRAKTVARYFDTLLTLHAFEPQWFEPFALKTYHVGNAVFDTDYTAGDPQELRNRYNLADRPILSVFLGSRMGEVVRLSPLFTDAVQILKTRNPEIAVISPVSDAVAKEVGAAAGADPRMNDMILLPETDKLAALACATAALACSGTVTTQLACAGVPTVVAYKMSAVTHAIVSRLFKPDYISMVNISAESALMPEFVQGEVTGLALANALEPFLRDTKKRAAASDALVTQTALMSGTFGKTASARAAEAVLKSLA